MANRKALGKRLRQRREATGLTQAEVAAQLGVSQEAVSRWEGGITRIGLDELTAIAGVLQVQITWLLSGEGESPPAYVQREPKLPKMGHVPVSTASAKKKGRQA